MLSLFFLQRKCIIDCAILRQVTLWYGWFNVNIPRELRKHPIFVWNAYIRSNISQQIQIMPNMLHLSKFPLPRVHFELAKFKWVAFYFWKLIVGKVVSSFFESIQLKIIKCFIYDYLVVLMHSILSSLKSPMDNLGCSKNYFLFRRKWVDEVIGYYILFTDHLISKAMHSVLLLTGLAQHPKSPRNKFVSTSSSSFPLPLFQELSQIPSSM